MKQLPIQYQIIAWYGVAAVLLAYGLVTSELLVASHPIYLVLNGTGATALIIQALRLQNWQLVVLNGVWLSIALYGTVTSLLQ